MGTITTGVLHTRHVEVTIGGRGDEVEWDMIVDADQFAFLMFLAQQVTERARGVEDYRLYFIVKELA